MYAKTKIAEFETRMMNIEELAAYIGMGRTKSIEFGERCGAKRKMGKRTLYDKRVVDEALDALEVC